MYQLKGYFRISMWGIHKREKKKPTRDRGDGYFIRWKRHAVAHRNRRGLVTRCSFLFSTWKSNEWTHPIPFKSLNPWRCHCFCAAASINNLRKEGIFGISLMERGNDSQHEGLLFILSRMRIRQNAKLDNEKAMMIVCRPRSNQSSIHSRDELIAWEDSLCYYLLRLVFLSF